MVLKDITIKKIELNNIRMFENLKREFFKGYNFIQGDNGTGKTTILLCIGSILGFISAKSLLRDGSSKGSINLIIDIDGKEYIIYKELIRKGDSVRTDLCYVKDEQGKHKQDVTGLKEYIINLLNISDSKSIKSESEIYRYAIFSPQGEMTKILSTQKKDIDERNQTLRKTFRTEEYKNARDIAKELIIQINKKSAYLKGRSEDIEIRKKSFENESRDVSKINNENENLNFNKVECKEDLEKYNNLKLSKEEEIGKYSYANAYIKIIEQSNINNDIEAISNNISTEYENKDNINDYIESYRKKISEINSDMENNINIIEELKEKEKDLKKYLEQLLRKNAEENNINIIEELKEKEKDLKKYLEQLLRKNAEENNINIIEELKKEKELLEKDRNELLVQRALKNERIKEYDNVKDKIACYTCGQKIDKKLIEFNIEINKKEVVDIDEKIGKNDDNLNSVKQRIDFKQKTIEENKDEEEKYNKLIEENKDEEEKYNKLIEENKDEEEKYNKLIEENKDEEEKYNKLIEENKDEEEKYNKLIEENKDEEEKYNKLIEKCEGRKKIIEEHIHRLNKNLADKEIELQKRDELLKLHSTDSTLYDELLKELKDISLNIESKNTEYNEIEKKLVGNIATINQKNKNINDLRVEIENKEEDIKKFNVLEEYLIFLKGFSFATDKIEKNIFTKMRNKFNRYMKELSFSIMNKKNIKIEINEDFTPIIRRNDLMVDIEDISGGEQASIAFSYRVVLNMVVSDLVGINLPLIFDEPTYGFSQAKLTNLRNSIKELRFNQLKNKQVIIVSHEEKFRDIADYSFKLINVNENTSVVEELENRTYG